MEEVYPFFAIVLFGFIPPPCLYRIPPSELLYSRVYVQYSLPGLAEEGGRGGDVEPLKTTAKKCGVSSKIFSLQRESAKSGGVGGGVSGFLFLLRSSCRERGILSIFSYNGNNTLKDKCAERESAGGGVRG